jgi:hypothetical protein
VLILYREIIAVCSEIHTKHINPLCGQNVEFMSVKLGGKVSNIIKRFMDNIKLLLIFILRVLLSHPFIFFKFRFFTNVYTVLFLFNNAIYAFILLRVCIFIYVYV